MDMQQRWFRRLATGLGIAGLSLGLIASGAYSYPGGTPDFQTDVGPYCAGCHSSTSEDDLSGLGDRATTELALHKHFDAIRAGTGNYADLSEPDRVKLVELLSTVDKNSTIGMEFPPSVTPGSTFQVIIKVTGGAGPAVAVGLVDRPHRFFARPASALGWEVVGAPTIIGPKGPQSDWLERRPEREGRSITFVNVSGMQSNAESDKWARAKIIFTLKAPEEIGDYPLVGAYFYGTETGVSLSTRMDPVSGPQPLGGALGNSGRVKFSKTAVITVKEADPQPVAEIQP
jgi:hypothetical protein